MVGEFVAKRDDVTVKVAKMGSIFTYQLRITPKAGLTTELTIMSYKLKVIDSNQIIQTLEEFNPEKPNKFQYYPLLNFGF